MQFEPRLALLLCLADYDAVYTFSSSRIMYLVASRIILSNVLFFVRVLFAIVHLLVYRRLTSIPYLGIMVGAYCAIARSEEHTSELQSLMRISYAVFCLKKKTVLTTIVTTALYINMFTTT